MKDKKLTMSAAFNVYEDEDGHETFATLSMDGVTVLVQPTMTVKECVYTIRETVDYLPTPDIDASLRELLSDE